MSLLDNAIRSIQIGLDDYWEDDRLVSSIRNIYAGILLLFKHKLFILSPPDSDAVLIKQNIIPIINNDGIVTWKGSGTKTIDVTQIKTRLQSLEIDVDWNTFNRVNKYRNEIEHFYSETTEKQTIELLAGCFAIINKFLSEHLHLNPKNVLGDEAWEVLLGAHEVYEFELKKSETAMESQVFHHNIIKEIFLSFCCEACSSPFIYPSQLNTIAEGSSYHCLECEQKYSYEEVCDLAIIDFYKEKFYSGYDSSCPFENCNICDQGIYLKAFQVCTACGTSK